MIAEGIETESMLDFLEHAGRTSTDRQVHAVQGYLTGRPNSSIVQAQDEVQVPRQAAV